MNRKPQSADEYIASQPIAVRAILERVRTAIRKALPDAEESISYGMPAYKVAGKSVLHFAAWKQHYSIYPIGARLAAAFQNELTPYELSKSTLKFPLTEPVPTKLIGRIAKFRSKEGAERTNAKHTAREP